MRGLRFVGRLFVVVVVSALALEGLVRVNRLAPPIDAELGDFTRDGDLPFRRRPHARLTGRSVTGEFDYDYQHNSEGFRDIEHAVAKPPDVFRMVMLGDSFTYGAGARFDETYPQQLAQLLSSDAGAASGRRVEIVNLGLPRYFPALERLALERVGLRYQPDLVVVGLLPNDVLDTYHGVEGVTVDESGFLISRRGERMGHLAPWLYLHSHVFRIVLRRIADVLPAEESPHPEDIYRADGFHETDWRSIESELDAMRRLAVERGARFAIVTIPQVGYARPERAYPDARLGRWSAAHDVLFISAREALLREGSRDGLYWPRDGHCTGAGYQVIARAVADGLRGSTWWP